MAGAASLTDGLVNKWAHTTIRSMSAIKNVYSIRGNGNSLKIVIHNRRHWPTILWAIVCIATAIPLALIVILALSADPGGVAIVLVVILLLVGGMLVVCIPILRWQFGGIETITVTPKYLKLTRLVSTTTREERLERSTITALSVMSTEHDIGWRWRYLRPTTISTFHIGRIAVECGEAVYRFGSGLTSTEATEIVEAIKKSRTTKG